VLLRRRCLSATSAGDARPTTSLSASRRDSRCKRRGCTPAAPARAGLSPVAWRRLSPVEKLQALYGLPLDAALDDLSYRGDDPHRLAARTSARHDVIMICAKYRIEMSRGRERQFISHGRYVTFQMAEVARDRCSPKFSRSLPGCGRRPHQREGAGSDYHKRRRKRCALSQGKQRVLSLRPSQLRF